MNLEPMHGRAARHYECGSFGQLTAREIAGKAGVSLTTVYARTGRGVTGDDLVQPPQKARPGRRSVEPYKGRSVFTCGNMGIAVAVQMARKYPHAPPSVDQLRMDFDMSRATAYRWRAAFVYAMGLQS